MSRWSDSATLVFPLCAQGKNSSYDCVVTTNASLGTTEETDDEHMNGIGAHIADSDVPSHPSIIGNTSSTTNPYEQPCDSYEECQPHHAKSVKSATLQKINDRDKRKEIWIPRDRLPPVPTQTIVLQSVEGSTPSLSSVVVPAPSPTIVQHRGAATSSTMNESQKSMLPRTRPSQSRHLDNLITNRLHAEDRVKLYRSHARLRKCILAQWIVLAIIGVIAVAALVKSLTINDSSLRSRRNLVDSFQFRQGHHGHILPSHGHDSNVLKILSAKLVPALHSTSTEEFGGRDVLFQAPVGAVLWLKDGLLPDGFLHCNGATLLRSEYPALFDVIGTKFGSGSETTFKLPKLNGRVQERQESLKISPIAKQWSPAVQLLLPTSHVVRGKVTSEDSLFGRWSPEPARMHKESQSNRFIVFVSLTYFPLFKISSHMHVRWG